MTELSRIWRETEYRYRLIGNKCNNCKRVYFPPRDICPYCHRDSIGRMEKYQLNGTGEIISYTTVHEAAPAFKRQVPYTLALVKLDEGPVITAQLTGNLEGIDTGKRVHMVFRRIRQDGEEGIIEYGYKFEMD
ncbi:Zn-ribbon domain-containing OB-fold protein [Picrophilus oshimae]|uniref:Zn-ribbon domain-containing OB-fold protein n=1 Tax=Picrophilus torridus (strain ATCC 700027 / DSM 9790 / JCM 10055 / NBRC 100828 / KAW 2/3) TaxID=1122961 RepID=Q6L235_PICTO|nr:Zn-ribbon domain-containing OB-fold protein [Picrophilus oshimae]AAT42967.1 hypothetical protein DUF35 [Picrophilus oshimae DSM 9789]SMD30731.1 hypothetical protein SAMN02745355_0625 [Picrophilus oshimae DSM 9789]